MSENQTKKFLIKKKMKWPQNLQNLKQGRGSLPAYCGTTVCPNYEWFGRYGFSPYVKVFDSRTMTHQNF